MALVYFANLFNVRLNKRQPNSHLYFCNQPANVTHHVKSIHLCENENEKGESYL